jgi:uncharacterized RDD family membrane protein YckC
VPPGYYYGPVRPPVPMSPGGLPLADFGTRLVAYIIDSLLMSVVALAVAVPGFIWIFSKLPDPAGFDTPGQLLNDFIVPLLLLELALFVVMLIAYYLYSVEYAHRSGQTLGKKAMKIRIIPLDPHLRYTRGMAAKRFLIEYVGGVVVPFFSYLDGLWQLWDKPYQQALHDKVAATVVVKVSP